MQGKAIEGLISMAGTDLLNDKLWADVSDGAQADFLRVGEEMVRSTLSLGHGADLRATTMMGIFGAVGMALFAATATLVAASHPYWPAIIAATVAASGLFLASAFCAAAAWPRYFFVAGFEPRSLINSSARNDRFRARVLIAVVQDRIDHNRRAITRAARLAMAAVWIAGFSVAGAIAVFLFLAGRLA
jgi:hypothetical protein